MLFLSWEYISGKLSQGDINQDVHYYLIIGYNGKKKKKDPKSPSEKWVNSDIFIPWNITQQLMWMNQLPMIQQTLISKPIV